VASLSPVLLLRDPSSCWTGRFDLNCIKVWKSVIYSATNHSHRCAQGLAEKGKADRPPHITLRRTFQTHLVL
jgi:hypothetical protein